MSVLVEHFERRLGPMTGEMRFAGDNPVTVAVFQPADSSEPGMTSYATIGLSARPLRSIYDGRSVRVEMVASEHTRDDRAFGPLPSVLDYIARGMVDAGQAILRGDLIDLGRPVTDESTLTWMYAAQPAYIDVDFESVTLENGNPVAVRWLVPIAAAEAAYVRRHGWQEFDGILLDRDPDLLDLDRPEMEGLRPEVLAIPRRALGATPEAVRPQAAEHRVSREPAARSSPPRPADGRKQAARRSRPRRPR